MNPEPDGKSGSVTIVSACDRNFIWGAFLLAASVARHLPGNLLHVFQPDFTTEDSSLLEQFPNVRVSRLSDDNPRNVSNRKAEAILAVESEYIAWFDSDCMVIGDVGPMLVPSNGEFQIRLRKPRENEWVWRNHYASGEARGGVPASVLEKWRGDVGQLHEPRLNTTCVANAFVLHRGHLPFIRQWQEQIVKVLSPSDTGVVDRTNPAYFMIDESVLSSLLAFSETAPPICDIMLNRYPMAHLAHFGANPKPWKRWRSGIWYCNSHVLELLDWVRSSGRKTPTIPWSFSRRNRFPAWLLAAGEGCLASARSAQGKLLRSIR
jgi:hypothetical protein